MMEGVQGIFAEGMGSMAWNVIIVLFLSLYRE